MFGRVLVVGGCDQMIGAPAFAALAALRMGCGLVKIAAPRDVLAAVLTVAPEATGLALGGAAPEKRLLEAAKEAHAVIVGPGLGQSADAVRRVLALVRLDKPMVLDADALNILAAQSAWPRSFAAQAVLTPHPGEMKRLVGLCGAGFSLHPEDKVRAEACTKTRAQAEACTTSRAQAEACATKAARAFGQVVLLKGHRTVVSDGRRLYVNHTGDSTLAKAGSGDVLSGMIGCLLAQGMDRFDAACLAAHIHGLAGEIAGRRLGQRCALARDVIDALPQAIARHVAGSGTRGPGR